MSFSSNGTSSLYSKVEGESLGSCPTVCVVYNLPIKEKKLSQCNLYLMNKSMILNEAIEEEV
jgi:hypothetical protein